MELYSARSLFLRVLIGCFVAAVTAIQLPPMQLKVFRGTLVHSRVRTEMEVLEDYLLGIDESNYGTVSTERVQSIYNTNNIEIVQNESSVQIPSLFTNKHGKVVLNEKTINGLRVCSRIVY